MPSEILTIIEKWNLGITEPGSHWSVHISVNPNRRLSETAKQKKIRRLEAGNIFKIIPTEEMSVNFGICGTVEYFQLDLLEIWVRTSQFNNYWVSWGPKWPTSYDPIHKLDELAMEHVGWNTTPSLAGSYR